MLYSVGDVPIKGISSMAIMQVVVTMEYYSQTALNVFHYIASGDPGPVSNSFALIAAMGFAPPLSSPYEFEDGTIARYMQALQSAQLKYRSIFARDLYSDTDFYETAFHPSTQGIAAGDALPPFVAYGFRGSRVNASIRRGSKRFCGVVEGNVAAGGILTSEALTYGPILADLMGDTLGYSLGGASLTFVPAVLQLEKYTTDEGKTAYRKYADPAVQLTHTAVGVEYSLVGTVRSQVSRQYGRGS